MKKRFFYLRQFSKDNCLKKSKGFGVVELLVVMSFVIFALVSLIQLYNLYLRSQRSIGKYNQAIFLAQGAIEAVRSVRDDSWDNISNLTMGLAYHPIADRSSGKWILSPGQELINGFTREIVFESVNRDARDNIAEIGGVDDPDTKKVNVRVSWNENEKTRTLKLTTFITNWR